MRRNPARRSTRASMSADTRATIEPTVRQAMRINSTTAVLEHWVASQATVSSKSRVWPTPWRAQGTWITVGPCVGQFTRGASASKNTGRVPKSSARQTPPALASVEPRRPPAASAAPPSGALARPHRHHHGLGLLIEDHRLDDHARQPEHALPYPRVPHPVSASRFAALKKPETYEAGGVQPRMGYSATHGRVRGARFVGVVGARGDRHVVLGEHRADRLDPEPVPMRVDVVDDQRSRRSSSAAAKNADAVLRI